MTGAGVTAYEIAVKALETMPNAWHRENRGHDPQECARLVVDALLALPVEERMDAMEMTAGAGQLVQDGSGSRWVATWREQMPGA